MHKTEYEESVKKPMEELVEALAHGISPMRSRSSGIGPSPPFPHTQDNGILKRIRPSKAPVEAVFLSQVSAKT